MDTLKDYFLKVIKTDKIFLSGHAEDCASELADAVKEFNEWKDVRLFNGTIIITDGFYFYGKKYTHDDLFFHFIGNIYENPELLK